MNRFKLTDNVRQAIEKVSEVGHFLWQREWAERNGGNISIDITEDIDTSRMDLNHFSFVPYPGLPKAAKNKIYFVKGQGERIRELSQPDIAGCILKIDERATGYHLLWGGRNKPDYKPTSEFISHVKILLDQYDAGNRCVVHTHPHELIALSHHPKLGNDSHAFNLACASMLPEVRVFVPKGIKLVPYLLSGSESLADATTEALKHFDVAIWEKHGAVAVGRDALEAFDFIDVANKGAKIYLTCLKSGFEPVGLSSDQLHELEQQFIK